jgi:RNA polymerase sigma-70 factor, ECF subfamily
LTEPATVSPPATDLGGALVRRAQEGDVDAFEGLYRRNVGRVYALCLRMTGDSVAAEELTQSVWVRAWERLDTFRGESAFSSWIHRLTVNLVLSERRSDSRRRARVELEGDVADVNADSATPPPQVETRIALERAVAELPEGARTVFVLHDVEGYRHADIAEQMGTAVGTVKSQLHRARKLLREALQ